MPKLLTKLIFISPVLLTIVAVNYFVDPSHVFDDDAYANEIAGYMLDNYNIANYKNMDDRLLLKHYFAGTNQLFDNIILGSSRSMTIGEEYFKGKTFLNCSVTGCGLGDLLAIYRFMQSNNKIPRYLLISVDPWFFNKNNQYVVKESAYYDYFKILDDIGLSKPFASAKIRIIKFKLLVYGLLDLDYFNTSLKKLYLHGVSRDYFIPLKGIVSATSIRMHDGSRREPIKQYIPINVRSIALEEAHAPYGFWNYKDINEDYKMIFEKFALYAQRQGASISLILMPYHPSAYTSMSNNPSFKIINDVEMYIRNFAQSNQIKVFGSYNPYNLAMDETLFQDGNHLSAQGIQKFMQITRLSELYDLTSGN